MLDHFLRALKEMLDLQDLPLAAVKDEWKSVTTMSGVQCVMTGGMMRMLWLFAGN